MLGEYLKERGIALAVSTRGEQLRVARAVAVHITSVGDVCDASRVRSYFEEVGGVPDLGNAWGALFREKRWEPAGYVKATHADAHARMIRRWRRVW